MVFERILEIEAEAEGRLEVENRTEPINTTHDRQGDNRHWYTGIRTRIQTTNIHKHTTFVSYFGFCLPTTKNQKQKYELSKTS